MSYKIVWNSNVDRAVRTWVIPDNAYVETRLRVNTLADHPATKLTRVTAPLDGMALVFQMIDPHSRLCEHFCRFDVLYGQDEETLYVVQGTYPRKFG